jgi:hypothetical protein
MVSLEGIKFFLHRYSIIENIIVLEDLRTSLIKISINNCYEKPFY